MRHSPCRADRRPDATWEAVAAVAAVGVAAVAAAAAAAVAAVVAVAAAAAVVARTIPASRCVWYPRARRCYAVAVAAVAVGNCGWL